MSVKRIPWRHLEDMYLMENYLTMTDRQLSEKLSSGPESVHRSKGAVFWRREQLGLRKRSAPEDRLWYTELSALLKQLFYRGGAQACYESKELRSRFTKGEIKRRLLKDKLMQSRQRWTEDEIRDLRKHFVNCTIREMTDPGGILAHRSYHGTMQKAHRIGLCGRQ